MKTAYKLSFEIGSPEKLATIIQVLAREVRDFKVEEVESSSTVYPSSQIKRKTFLSKDYTLDTYIKNSQACKILFNKYAVDEEFSLSMFGKILEDAGLSPSSDSPTCCRLRQAGYLERTAPGTYKRIK